MAQKLKLLLLVLSFLFISIVNGYCVDYTADVNCQGAWLMDYNENPIRDDSQNSWTGAVEGDTVFNASGKFGGCYSFDGAGDYINHGDITNIEGVEDFTLVFYAYPDTVTGNDDLISKGAWGDTFHSHFYGTAQIFYGYSDGKERHATDSNSATAETWNHIAFLFDGSEHTHGIYTGGITEGSTTGALNTTQNSAANFQIGGVNQTFQGDMDEVAVFDRLLTSTEINDIMDNGLVPSAPPPSFISKVVFF